MKTSRFTLLELITVVALLALVVIMFGTACASGVGETKKRVNCAGHLKQVGLALLMYSGDYDGFFPVAHAPGGTNFQPLDTRHLADGPAYACPSAGTGNTTASNSDYRYRGSGLKDDNDQRSAITLAYDKSGNHPKNSWMNALFIDGHVEGAKPDGQKQPNGWNVNN